MADKHSLRLVGYLYAGITAVVLLIAAAGVGADLYGRSAANATGAPAAKTAGAPEYEIDSAFQGAEGAQRVREACEAGRPCALAFALRDERVEASQQSVAYAGLRDGRRLVVGAHPVVDAFSALQGLLQSVDLAQSHGGLPRRTLTGCSGFTSTSSS